jgi:2-amino-4-hydroxy-6-hydroxymethyldihydropteridine diphosphokinase
MAFCKPISPGFFDFSLTPGYNYPHKENFTVFTRLGVRLSDMYHVYLGLGTNLGQREKNLQNAIDGLGEAIYLTAVSPIYETTAWGVTDQPDFLNMCAAGETTMPPIQLLGFVKQLEVQLGRKPEKRWGPRLIDIDILLYEELVVRSLKLDVPHKGMADRATVLLPLADIAPDLLFPLTGQTVGQLLAAVDSSGVRPYP